MALTSALTVPFFLVLGLVCLFEARGDRTDLSRGRYLNVLRLLLAFLCFLTLVIALNRGFSIDEFEHVHSAWYLSQGQRPYSDFFQHHHPLLWLIIVPFLRIVGETVTVLLVLRVFMFALALGIGGMVYLMVLRITRSREAALLGAVLLFAQVMFCVFAIQIRPDIPQVFFGLLGLHLLLVAFDTGARGSFVGSGVSLAISFLFLQKTIFLAPALGLLLLRRLWRGDLPVKSLVIFSLSLLAPLLPFFLALFLIGSPGDYVLTNWLINLKFARGDTFSFLRTLNYYILKDLFFWIMAVLSMIFAWRGKDAPAGLRATTLTGLVLFMSLFLVKRPWGHHFLFLLTVLAVGAGTMLFSLLNRTRVRRRPRVLIVILVVLSPLFFLLERTEKTNTEELNRAAYVLRHTRPSDRVYDGKNLFNLFRHDLHYFWFSLKDNHGLDTYNRLSNNRFGDYDICRLIREKRPRFISDFRVDFSGCGLNRLYRPTPYAHLFVRREGDGEGR